MWGVLALAVLRAHVHRQVHALCPIVTQWKALHQSNIEQWRQSSESVRAVLESWTIHPPWPELRGGLLAVLRAHVHCQAHALQGYLAH